jgi:hypothetical protein
MEKEEIKHREWLEKKSEEYLKQLEKERND